MLCPLEIHGGQKNWIGFLFQNRLQIGWTDPLLKRKFVQLSFSQTRKKPWGWMIFPQQCFKNVGTWSRGFIKSVMEFYNSRVINQSTNATFIALVSRRSQTVKISYFRPISLVSSLYNIIAKVLLGRIQRVAHEIIHIFWGAFVVGRQILDAILIANKMVDEKRKLREEGVVFKIGFEKAYNHVDWGFWDRVLD